MTKEIFFEALKNATNGTFEGSSGMETCMGWTQEYDRKGRPLHADPNYLDYTIRIDGVDYSITKTGWLVFVWKPENPGGYTCIWDKERKKEHLLYEYDITPDYVKEYYAEKESSRKTE